MKVPNMEPPGVISCRVKQHSFVSIRVWKYTRSIVNHTRSLEPHVRVLIEAPPCRHDWLPRWGISVPSLSRDLLMLHDPTSPHHTTLLVLLLWPAPILNHVIRLSWHKVQTLILLSGMTCQGLGDNLPEIEGKVQTSPWAIVRFFAALGKTWIRGKQIVCLQSC